MKKSRDIVFGNNYSIYHSFCVTHSIITFTTSATYVLKWFVHVNRCKSSVQSSQKIMSGLGSRDTHRVVVRAKVSPQCINWFELRLFLLNMDLVFNLEKKPQDIR